MVHGIAVNPDNGNVLGAIGNGPGAGDGQFYESAYMAMDAKGNLYAGDTGLPHVTMVLRRQTRDFEMVTATK